MYFPSRFDSERSPENRLYLDCFCVVAGGIGVSGGSGIRGGDADRCEHPNDESSHITTVF